MQFTATWALKRNHQPGRATVPSYDHRLEQRLTI
jgi:hypothetical protein